MKDVNICVTEATFRKSAGGQSTVYLLSCDDASASAHPANSDWLADQDMDEFHCTEFYAIPKSGLSMGDICTFAGLEHFDFAIPKGFMDAYPEFRGVWSYDESIGYDGFGGALSLEWILDAFKLEIGIAITEYELSKLGGQDE